VIPASQPSSPKTLGDRVARWVVRHRLAIVVVWIMAAAISKIFAPSWKEIAYDGDFDYLPATMSSVSAERLLDEAFPVRRSRSQIVLVLARDQPGGGEANKLDDADELVGLDLLRRLYHRMAELTLVKDIENVHADNFKKIGKDELFDVRTFLDESIRLDQLYFDKLTRAGKVDAIPPEQLRLTLAYWDRGLLLDQLGEEELAASDTQAALILNPDIAASAKPFSQRDLTGWNTVVDLRAWLEAVIGSQMSSPSAKLAILLSDAELAATSNIDFLAAVHELRDGVLSRHQSIVRPGLELLATGSAAIGGQTLTAARDAIRYTELLTVLMILLILAAVYRAPLLVLIPVVSIAIAVMVSSGLVAWLTVASKWADSPWLDFKIFTTSRIFVVVILFGAGTDFCLFLISRLREELDQWSWDEACQRSLSGVSGALVGSAMTTIVGLGMLWIAEFGKFAYTGPIVAICLAIGLLVCLTFTPAILSLVGPKAFWPSNVSVITTPVGERLPTKTNSGLWGLIALKLTRYPVATIVVGLGLLCPPAIFGYLNEDNVTYDISSQLNRSAESRRGLRLVQEHFDIGRVNPLTLLIVLPKAISNERLRDEAKSLAEQLYKIDGVVAVRSADDPLGDFPPDRAMSLLSADAWKRRALKTHRITRNYFFSDELSFQNRLARLDVVMEGNPFDIGTANKVKKLETSLGEITDEASFWKGSKVRFAGTTPSIIDLRTVTLSDNRRIKIAVVAAVFVVLVIVIRRVVLCGYLIATVLLSFYATLGLSILFFRFAYGDDYVGLDWKLPLFLFVILVAVGQDYNVYLVTRIIEEQSERSGWLSALRRAVARTGGIITACGLVMSATFFSMTASAWLPWLANWIGLGSQHETTSLRGIVELGFALGLGVLIDTFYVRTILVPSFVALTDRFTNTRRLPSFPGDDTAV